MTSALAMFVFVLLAVIGNLPDWVPILIIASYILLREIGKALDAEPGGPHE